MPGSPPAKSYLNRFLVPRKPPGPPRTPHRNSIGGEPQLPPDLELHLTLDFYFVYEFHLTLLGSPRELTAQATERPLDLYSKYEFHFTLRSSRRICLDLLLRSPT